MKLILEDKEKETIFLTALETLFGDFNFGKFDYNGIEYQKSKAKLNNPSYEEILMQLLKDGNAIIYKDDEDDSLNTIITLQSIYDAFEKIPISIIITLDEEFYDYNDAHSFMQYILFGEIIY